MWEVERSSEKDSKGEHASFEGKFQKSLKIETISCIRVSAPQIGGQLR